MAAPLRRRVKEFAKRRLGDLFEVGQRLGVDILPRHFYSSIPDMRTLRRDDAWKQPRSLFGVRGADVDEQLAFVADCCPEPLRQRQREGTIYSRACEENGEAGFGPIEADFLHCFIATKRPRRVVQVGAGVSTSIILNAAKEAGYDGRVVCIDPYPTQFLRDAAARGRIRLVPEPAQKVALDELTGVGADGLLYVDSTHTVKPGSEVNRLVLEGLPRLPQGAYVHFHDINLPYDYPRGLFARTMFFWEETTLLLAFLINNPGWTIRASLSMLHYARPAELQKYLPNYRPAKNDHGLGIGDDPGHFPSSTYLQVVPAETRA
jgi:hypothetical protein